MPDTNSTSDSSEKLRELEKKIKRLENNSSGRNQIEIEAYDISVSIKSEDATVEEMAEIASEEMEVLTKRALIGEYQELETQDLFGQLFGGNR